MDLLKQYIKENSTITNKEAEDLGYSRYNLQVLTNAGKLKRLRPGLYQVKDELVDDFVMIASKSKRIIFSYQTALYLHDLSDRTPNVFHISVPQGYNASHIKKRNDNIQVHYIKKDIHELGVTEINTPLGNKVLVYNLERTICDLIVDREKIDKQIFIDGITRYFKSDKKDLRQLIKYSRVFGIEEDVRKYMEVLS